MSNEYENQLARERQEKRDHQRKLEQAAQRAAQSAELARLEQNASLRKQEEIAETNSFRTTVLGTLALLDDRETANYITQQISHRLPHFENNQLKIKNKADFYDSTGLSGYIKDFAEQFKKTNEWSAFIENCSTHNKLSEKYKDQIARGILDSNLEFRRKLGMPGGLISIIILIILTAHSPEMNKADSQSTIWFLISMFFLGGIYFMYWWNKMFTEFKNLKQIKIEINQKTSEVKNKLIETFKKSDFKTNLLKQSPQSISEIYFDKFVYTEVQNEQSFLPPKFQINSEIWKSHTITNSTLVSIKDLIIEAESKIENQFTWDWFTTGVIKIGN